MRNRDFEKKNRDFAKEDRNNLQPSSGDSSPWYLPQCNRGEELLSSGKAAQAREIFEDILARFDDAPSYGKAVVLERLGRCCHVERRHDLAVAHIRNAIAVTDKLAPSDGVKGLRGTLHSDLGEVLRATGRYVEARKSYEAALKIAERLKDLRAQAVDLGQLGTLALAEGKLDEALTRYRAALRLFQKIHEPAMEAAAWHQLGRVFHAQREWNEAYRHYREAARINEERGNLAGAAQAWGELAVVDRDAGRPAAAETWYRKAIDVLRTSGNHVRLARHLSSLADLLRSEPDRLAEARRSAEAALVIAQEFDPVGAEVWSGYGMLADILDQEAASAESERRTTLQARSRDYRELERRAPVIIATLALLGDVPSLGRAVILGRLGLVFRMCGRPELAVARIRDAIDIATKLAPDDDSTALRGALYSDLGDVLEALGQGPGAAAARAAALTPAAESQDLREEAAESATGAVSGLTITLHEEHLTDYIFDTDLLVDGPRRRKVGRQIAAADPLADDVRPMLVPGARTFVDHAGAVCFALPLTEPRVERHSGYVVMRRTRREVSVAGSAVVLWGLIRALDGVHTVGQIQSRMTREERPAAAALLGTLATAGVIDVAGRAIGHFVHLATKKGVLPGGGLEGDEVLQLATDHQYRVYPQAPGIALSQTVPESLRTFHALTRKRRSRRDYSGRTLRRADFDALLHVACGVTGTLPWADREVRLRAYPSSGALYAVEIYPIALRVAGLEPALYHYRAAESALELVRRDLDRDRIIDTALPVERAMVAGAAAMICLTGNFARHERKYGEGGYRMLVAEAGHISQNLILAATALGIAARPFGGVFDSLLNQELGLLADDEQFLLAVLVGLAGEQQSATLGAAS